MKKIILLTIFICSCIFLTWAQEEQNLEPESQKVLYTEKQKQLKINADDVRLVPDKNGGYHLYVRKNPKVNSIILTETTKDPNGKQDSYAYRAKEYNSINGDEIRYLDGKKLESEGAKYSLVDSTVEKTSFFDEAFHIYIPETIIYGYEWSRNGEVHIGKGTFINIRSFEKPYADYSGDYMDSPFMFDLKIIKKRVTAKPEKEIKTVKEEIAVAEEEYPVEPIEETILTDDYNPIASEKFKEISEDIIYSKGPSTIIEDIAQILDGIENKDNLDVVFAIDATGSMKDDIEQLKKELTNKLMTILGENTKTRLGLLFYRDYGDSYKYMNLPVRILPFTSNFNSFAKNLNSVKIIGKEGGDIPEAVYEAMYASVRYYDWREDSQRQIILIGDAEPHPTPRGSGKYSKEYVMKYAKEKNVKIHSILLPNK